MDEWRDEKEGNEWGTRTNWLPKQNKNGGSTVPQGIMVTRMDTNVYSSCQHLLLCTDYK